MDQKTDVKIFDFNDQMLRTVMVNNQPWVVAADVCRILDLDQVSRALSRLNDTQKGVTTVKTLGGAQQMNIVSESGVYKLIFTSRKPEAEAFQDWVTGTVLPALRRDGFYSRDGVNPQLDFKTCMALIDRAERLGGKRAAVQMWQKLPIPRPALFDGQAADFIDIGEDAARFLEDMFEVTGDPKHSFAAPALINMYAQWREECTLNPLRQTIMARQLADTVQRYRCPHTGKMVERRKRSTWFYDGLRLRHPALQAVE